MGFLTRALGITNEERASGQDYTQALQSILAGQSNPAGNPYFNQSNHARAEQQALSEGLMNTFQGKGPSIAQEMLRNQTDSNISQAGSLIGSQKGINAGLASRIIAKNAAAQNQQAAGQGSLMRAAEIDAAGKTLGGVLANKRDQDIAQTNAGFNAMGTLGGLQNNQSNINAGVGNNNANLAGSLAGQLFKAGGSAAGLGAAAEGGEVPGKAKVEGDSYANDTVPILASPGEVVVPRSVANSSPDKIADFVKAVKESNKQIGDDDGYGRVLKAQREFHDRLKKIEMMACGGMVR